MASKTPRKDKDGNITSYQIEVYRGRDSEGKKLKPYSMTWKIPDNWKSPTKIQKELERVAAQFEIDCKAGNVSLEKKTFKQYSEYVMKICEHNNKHRTVFRYQQLIDRINEELGHKLLNDITVQDLNMFYIALGSPGANRRNGEALTPKTIRHYHGLIHKILKQAVNENLIPYNVADRAEPPKLEKHPAEFFEIEEILAIRDALVQQPLKWQAITDLLIDTGARRGEILGLYWENIDFKNNKIILDSNLQYTSERGIYNEKYTKNGEIRTVSIAPEIMEVLQNHRKLQLQHQLERGSYWTVTNYCFTQENGLPMNPNSINKFLTKLSNECGIPDIHPHKFRHTQASLLYANNLDPILISKRLGHKNVSTTQNIYSHLLKGRDELASDAIANTLYRSANSKKSVDKSV